MISNLWAPDQGESVWLAHNATGSTTSSDSVWSAVGFERGLSSARSLQNCVCCCVQLHKTPAFDSALVLKVWKMNPVALTCSLSAVHRSDSEDEMGSEIEEAFENFCLESERKRQQWHDSENPGDSHPFTYPDEKWTNLDQIGLNSYFTKNKNFISVLFIVALLSLLFENKDNRLDSISFLWKCAVNVFFLFVTFFRPDNSH